MIQKFAKVNSVGVVENVQLVNPDVDVLNPNFTWVDIDHRECVDGSHIQIGCTYDGTNFHAQN